MDDYQQPIAAPLFFMVSFGVMVWANLDDAFDGRWLSVITVIGCAVAFAIYALDVVKRILVWRAARGR